MRRDTTKIHGVRNGWNMLWVVRYLRIRANKSHGGLLFEQESESLDSSILELGAYLDLNLHCGDSSGLSRVAVKVNKNEALETSCGDHWNLAHSQAAKER